MSNWLDAFVPLVERFADTPRLLPARFGCLSPIVAAACAPETARPPPPEQPEPAAPPEATPRLQPAVPPAPTDGLYNGDGGPRSS